MLWLCPKDSIWPPVLMDARWTASITRPRLRWMLVWRRWRVKASPSLINGREGLALPFCAGEKNFWKSVDILPEICYYIVTGRAPGRKGGTSNEEDHGWEARKDLVRAGLARRWHALHAGGIHPQEGRRRGAGTLDHRQVLRRSGEGLKSPSFFYKTYWQAGAEVLYYSQMREEPNSDPRRTYLFLSWKNFSKNFQKSVDI